VHLRVILSRTRVILSRTRVILSQFLHVILSEAKDRPARACAARSLGMRNHVRRAARSLALLGMTRWSGSG
jgi:hypothetical protein